VVCWCETAAQSLGKRYTFTKSISRAAKYAIPGF
jgi:hypothetical protein